MECQLKLVSLKECIIVEKKSRERGNIYKDNVSLWIWMRIQFLVYYIHIVLITCKLCIIYQIQLILFFLAWLLWKKKKNILYKGLYITYLVLWRKVHVMIIFIHLFLQLKRIMKSSFQSSRIMTGFLKRIFLLKRIFVH